MRVILEIVLKKKNKIGVSLKSKYKFAHTLKSITNKNNSMLSSLFEYSRNDRKRLILTYLYFIRFVSTEKSITGLTTRTLVTLVTNILLLENGQ